MKRRARLLSLMLAVALAVSGCNFFDGQGHIIPGAGGVADFFEATGAADASACVSSISPPNVQMDVACLYSVTPPGGQPANHSAHFILMSLYAVLFAFLDPLILQLPADYGTFDGTFDAGSGPRPLVIQSGLTAIPVTPGTFLRPEPGQQLIILDLPDDATSTLPAGAGPTIRYTLRSQRQRPPGQQTSAIQIKAMYAGRVEIQGQRFYVPTLPCVTTFANIPSVTVPVSANLVDLTGSIGSLFTSSAATGCNGTVYDFRSFDGTPIATPTPIVNPPTFCSPRPRVDVLVRRDGPGQFHGVIRATSPQSGNALRQVRFNQATNAIVTAGQQSGNGDFTVPLAPGTAEFTFTVNRVSPNQATTVPLVVTDVCGDWPTFVGIGRGVQ